MSCVCLPGFTGKGDVRCGKISKVKIRFVILDIFGFKIRNNRTFSKTYNYFIVEPQPFGCSSDSECSPSQACQSRSCINPCTTDKPCSQTAICSVKNHRATCTCPPSFEGDPYKQCTKSKNRYTLFTI